MKLGVVIKRERLKKKWRQEDLGNLLGRSQTNISDIENGEIPKFTIVCMLCEIFAISPNELWEEIRDEYT